MPDIIIENLNNLRLSCGDTANTVLNIVHNHFIDWMHACGGKGRCTTCSMQVLKGSENLSPINQYEIKFLEAGKLTSEERLACQSKVFGDVVIKVPDRNKLPHVTYSN